MLRCAKNSIQKFSFIIILIQIHNYNWSIFNRANNNQNKGEQRFNTMKNHKINFFESPNPLHFNFQNLNQCKYHHSEDPQVNEDRLFATPVKINNSFGASPTPNAGHYLSCPQFKPKRRLQDEISEENQQPHEKIEQQPASFQGIREKLVFSDNEEKEEEEDLLIPITPLKGQQKKQTGAQVTVRRQPTTGTASHAALTPISESRSVQRGLKKLAAQAYRFVVHQKKTSYKQVAKKLLEELGDEDQINVQKRGQLNIKRRVYDALNVLIALGLLKRNGHKLMIKKEEIQFTQQDFTYGRQRQRRRELAMKEQLGNLIQTCNLKENIIIQKRKMQQQIKEKLGSIKEMIEKNKNLQQQPSIENKIKFPLFVLSQKFQQPKFCLKKEKPDQEAPIQMKDSQSLKLWQANPEVLSCSFSKEKEMQLIGQIDVLAVWKIEQKRDKVKKTIRRTKNR